MRSSIKNLFPLLGIVILTACATRKSSVQSYSAFTTDQKELIMNGDGLDPMRVYLITDRSDSLLLRTKSENVKPDSTDEVLQRLIDRMYRTVRDSMSMGVGIAAPQVGILKNIIWVQRLDKKGVPFEAYLNPVITKYSKKKRPCREGCLSIPIRRDTTRIRSFQIKVAYDKIDGTHHKEKVEDFTSVIFQHEIDHLNGILYIDHLEQEVNDSEK